MSRKCSVSSGFLMTLILMALISVMIPIRSGSAQPESIVVDDTVDVLLAGDEEFMAAVNIDNPRGRFEKR